MNGSSLPPMTTQVTTDCVQGLLQLFYAMNNEPAVGTGIALLSDQTKNMIGNAIPPDFVSVIFDIQLNMFGDFGSKADVVPSAIFLGIFTVTTVLHSIIFSLNCQRGHYFWVQIIFIFHGMMRMVAFATRIAWGLDRTGTSFSMVTSVFAIVATIVMMAGNILLTQRLFTWRHPVGGNRRLFWNFMYLNYFLMIVLMTATIICYTAIFLYFLSARQFERYLKLTQATAVLIVLYCLESIALIGLSYWFKPTQKDVNLYTYQPWWIESFHLFYLVKRNAAQEAATTFMKRNHNHRHAICVIAATHHHYNMVQGLTNERGSLQHNKSLLIVVVATVIMTISSCLRCVVLFQARQRRYQSSLCKPVVMYICWGLGESITTTMYLIGRVDLRFYRPDRLPQAVRSIVTAEQTGVNSDSECDSYVYSEEASSGDQHLNKEKLDSNSEEFVF